MNKTLTFVAAGLLMASCSEKEFEPNIPTDKEGVEVSFQIGNNDTESRTMYGPEGWETDNSIQRVFWGPYLDVIGKDQIKVYCMNAAQGRQIASYDITPQDVVSNNSNIAKAVTRSEGQAYGVQWGSPTDNHIFYSFYPASKCGDEFVGGQDGVISANVESGQSPVTYKVVRGTTEQTNNALKWLGENPGAVNADNMTTIYGQPDMAAAVMAARTNVAPDAYGKPVSLSFSVLADVLDLTINGPVTPNMLAGETAKTLIHIKNVVIKSKSGAALSGDFTIDLSKSDMVGSVKPGTNTSSMIQLQTTQVTPEGTYFPALYVRSDNSTTPNVKEVDKLRLRAFLMPGQVTNLNDLEVTIYTDCGNYTQPLNAYTVNNTIGGSIYRVKFKPFYDAGDPLDFTKWMTQMNPNTYLSELSIPGSYASYSSNQSGSSKYQTYTFAEQYDKGVRAFQFNVGAYRSGRQRDPYMMEDNSVTLLSVLNSLNTLMSTREKEICFVIISPKQDGYTNIHWNNGGKTDWLNNVKSALAQCEGVFATAITKETTIKDVVDSGKRIIVKINSDGGYSGSGINALFSGWRDAGATGVDVVPLQWGTPIAASDANASTAMRWCYTEADNIGSDNSCQVTVQGRKDALTALVAKSLELRKENQFNTWIFASLGGFIRTTYSTIWGGVDNPETCATTFNPFMNQILSNPNRQACPMGIVLMNFAGDPAYSGDELISTIINNNRAFTPEQKGTKKSSVREKTNSNFPTGSNDAVE